jgi:hypothetical protein
LIEIFIKIANIFLNKYFCFYFGLLIFFMPLFYRFRLFLAEKKHIKMRCKIMNELGNDNTDWIEKTIPQLPFINTSIKSFSILNIISKNLFSINLFDNDEPTDNSGFVNCKLLTMKYLDHFVNLYNKSLFSGFWSLFFRPVTLLDENCSQMHIFKDRNNESRHMIIVIKFDKDYEKYFKFIIQ